MHQHPCGDKLLPVKNFLGIGVEDHRDSKEPVDALFLGRSGTHRPRSAP